MRDPGDEVDIACVIHVHFNLLFQAPVADAMAIVWEFFQPLLFGLIGAEVSIEYMDSALIGM